MRYRNEGTLRIRHDTLNQEHQAENVATAYNDYIMGLLADGWQIDREWYLHAELSHPVHEHNYEIECHFSRRVIREDLALWAYAERKGFTVRDNNRRSRGVSGYHPADSISFHKGAWTTWQCVIKGNLVWQTARHENGRLVDHHPLENLIDALEYIDNSIRDHGGQHGHV